MASVSEETRYELRHLILVWAGLYNFIFISPSREYIFDRNPTSTCRVDRKLRKWQSIETGCGEFKTWPSCVTLCVANCKVLDTRATHWARVMGEILISPRSVTPAAVFIDNGMASYSGMAIENFRFHQILITLYIILWTEVHARGAKVHIMSWRASNRIISSKYSTSQKKSCPVLH